ncbi:ABC transporter permease [Shouchella clausii]|uniref:ABC transporter permease n=1 Tax=Shouchella clausii TaxID=79880 RepID=UPI00280BD6DA|nr:ABC transporter permease [Shouchella clausii]WMM34135.1 ABC transporter permease [Shouchella clausii]
MGQLIISEFERLWSRWSIRLLVLALPLLVIVTGVYFQNHNQNRSMDAVDYATALNFPILSISEHLFITFNILLIFICAYVITEEYQQKQIKLIVLRAYSMSQIFLSKFIVMATSLFICFFLYYLASFSIGLIMFEMPERSILFVSEADVTNGEMVRYALNYYGIAFLTSLAALSLFCFIAILMPSVNALLGSGICILFFFIVGPQLLEQSTAFAEGSNISYVVYASITKIQYTGISLLLSGGELSGWLIAVTSFYLLVFLGGAYLVFTRRNYYV